MIKIIKKLRAKSLDLSDGIWHDLPLVPATGKLEITTKTEAAGRLGTAKIEATLSKDHDIIKDNLMLQIVFCSEEDQIMNLGSSDLPLRFDVSETDTLKLSCTYSWPIY